MEAILVKSGYSIDLSNMSFHDIILRTIVISEMQKLEAEEQEKAHREQERSHRTGAQTASLSRPIDPRPRPSLGRSL